jgi:hypothetical protein
VCSSEEEENVKREKGVSNTVKEWKTAEPS